MRSISGFSMVAVFLAGCTTAPTPPSATNDTDDTDVPSTDTDPPDTGYVPPICTDVCTSGPPTLEAAIALFQDTEAFEVVQCAEGFRVTGGGWKIGSGLDEVYYDLQEQLIGHDEFGSKFGLVRCCGVNDLGGECSPYTP